jgi:hypothetical protein
LFLLWCDNVSAESWTRKIAGLKGSRGRALALIFANLLMFSPDIDVVSKHIEGRENVLADYLSRARIANDVSRFSYGALLKQFPQMASCRRFRPSRELLSAIYDALLSGSAPQQETRLPLGRMTVD